MYINVISQLVVVLIDLEEARILKLEDFDVSFP